MERVAITGGIGTGKSTVLGYLREMGAEILSADDVAREVFESPEVQTRLAEILKQRPPVKPETLRKAIVNEPSIRRKANSAMHPSIVARLAESGAQFFEVPLLVETCTVGDYDHVWVVVCDEETQLDRVAERLGDRTSAKALIDAQLPTRVKEAFADALIRTNVPQQYVQEYVRTLAGRIIGERIART